MIVAITLVMAWWIFAPTTTNAIAPQSGCVVVILSGKVAISFDNSSCDSFEYGKAHLPKQAILMDTQGKVVYQESFDGDALTLGPPGLGKGTYTLTLQMGDCSKTTLIQL